MDLLVAIIIFFILLHFSLRLPQSTNSQSFEDVIRSIESRAELKKEAENSQ